MDFFMSLSCSMCYCFGGAHDLFTVCYFVRRCLHQRARLRFNLWWRQQARSKPYFAHPCFESFVPLLYEQLRTCLTQATSLTSCDMSYMRALVTSVCSHLCAHEHTEDPCGPNVDSMWHRFGLAPKTRIHCLKPDIAKQI